MLERVEFEDINISSVWHHKRLEYQISKQSFSKFFQNGVLMYLVISVY